MAVKRCNEGFLSGWELRVRAGKLGYPTTHKQLMEFQKWGILPKPQDKCYPNAALRRLIRAHRLAPAVRSVPRRALRLRRSYSFPGDCIREAILWVIPEIRRPRRKLRTLARLLRRLPGADDKILERAARLAVARWTDLVKSTDEDETLNDLVGSIYYFLANLLSWVPESKAQLDKEIPASEERMILVLVLHLARKEDALNASRFRQ
jgi:hypothetical protein